MKRALVQSTRVCEVRPIGADFPVALPLRWVDCADDVTAQHVFDGSAFSLPSPPAPAATEDANGVRQGLGSIFAGTAAQKRARMVDVVEKYPPFGVAAALLCDALGNDARAFVLEVATRVKNKIGTGATEVLTAAEYDALKAHVDSKNLGAIVPPRV
jgi:hypothetical protein